MKKSLVGLIVSGITAFALLLSGCAALTENKSGKSPDGADMLYTAECEVTVGGEDDKDDISYGGTLSRLGGGMWQFDITSPDTVKGLKLRLDENGINASLGDLAFNLEKDKIPSRAAFLKIFAALDNAAANKNSLDFSETEQNLVYGGNSGGEKYSLLCGKTDNRPCGINIGKISVVFLNFTVNGKAPESTDTQTGTQTESVASSVTSAETTVTTAQTTVTSVSRAPVTAETTVITTPFFTTSEETTREY